MYILEVLFSYLILDCSHNKFSIPIYIHWFRTDLISFMPKIFQAHFFVNTKRKRLIRLLTTGKYAWNIKFYSQSWHSCFKRFIGIIAVSKLELRSSWATIYRHDWLDPHFLFWAHQVCRQGHIHKFFFFSEHYFVLLVKSKTWLFFFTHPKTAKKKILLWGNWVNFPFNFWKCSWKLYF